MYFDFDNLSYEFVNQSDYELAVYWGSENSNILKHFSYIQNHSVGNITCNKNHRICIFHSLQVTNPITPNQVISEINIEGELFQRYPPIFDEYMKNIDINIITKMLFPL